MKMEIYKNFNLIPDEEKKETFKKLVDFAKNFYLQRVIYAGSCYDDNYYTGVIKSVEIKEGEIYFKVEAQSCYDAFTGETKMVRSKYPDDTLSLSGFRNGDLRWNFWGLEESKFGRYIKDYFERKYKAREKRLELEKTSNYKNKNHLPQYMTKYQLDVFKEITMHKIEGKSLFVPCPPHIEWSKQKNNPNYKFRVIEVKAENYELNVIKNSFTITFHNYEVYGYRTMRGSNIGRKFFYTKEEAEKHCIEKNKELGIEPDKPKIEDDYDDFRGVE